MGRKATKIKKSTIKNEEAKKPKQLNITEEQRNRVDALFSKSSHERVVELTSENYVAPQYCEKSVLRLMNRYLQLEPVEMQYLMQNRIEKANIMERATLVRISEMSNKGKAGKEAYHSMYEKLFGKAKQVQEITGKDGAPLYESNNIKLQEEVNSMSDEQYAKYKQIVLMKSELTAELEDEQEVE